ncbi:uncharacterized protein LOC135812470 [Sycon ciliatum]|uniref:uncharacterized protein LOC135812470 n=1 Tax=Sycon ciliatum TaxID=27933 RepID=UPI0031F621F4
MAATLFAMFAIVLTMCLVGPQAVMSSVCHGGNCRKATCADMPNARGVVLVTGDHGRVERLNCVPTQNWQRVISINPLSPGGCGGNLVSGTKSDRFGRQRTLCTRRIGSRGCAEITVNPSSAYRYVKGRITGFQYNTPDGFPWNFKSLTESYVDGVSITQVSPWNQRKHIYTYAVAFGEGLHGPHCPCNSYSTWNPQPQFFVGRNYTCAEFPRLNNLHLWHFDPQDHLFEGGYSCGPDGSRTGRAPEFEVDTGRSSTDPISLRLCMDNNYLDEDIGLDFGEIYVSA